MALLRLQANSQNHTIYKELFLDDQKTLFFIYYVCNKWINIITIGKKSASGAKIKRIFFINKQFYENSAAILGFKSFCSLFVAMNGISTNPQIIAMKT